MTKAALMIRGGFSTTGYQQVAAFELRTDCLNWLVMSYIYEYDAELTALAERYGVSRLELFGSTAGDTFDPVRSDLDFLVVFNAELPGGMAHAYFGLLGDLETLFNRSVDLVTDRSIKNPYFRKSVDESRRPVYVA